MAGIFVLGEDRKLIGLTEKAYDSEDLLQSLLATYPDILAGEQISPDAPRRWLLVSRETGIPDALDGGARWSLDHLFLDQDGIPTLVEVKRSTDSRIRREVVGQMLDYAANALVYLPIDAMRSTFEARCSADGLDPEQALAEAFGEEVQPDAFWVAVRTNMQAGHVRLVFVADTIPPELQRVIEFLNGQMSPAEVYGVEIKQYVGGTLQTLVPRLLGRTADAARAKGTSRPRGATWTMERFVEELERQAGARAVPRARRLLAWATDNGLRVWWGQGALWGGFIPVLDTPIGNYQFFEAWTDGRLELAFKWLATKPPFDDPGVREDLRRRLESASGQAISAGSTEKLPKISFASIPNDETFESTIEVFDWALGLARDRVKSR